MYLPTITLNSAKPTSTFSNIEVSSYWIHNNEYFHRATLETEDIYFEAGTYSLIACISTYDSDNYLMDYESFPDDIVLNGFTFRKDSECEYYVTYAHDFEAIIPAGTAPTITTTELEGGKLGMEYSQELNAWGSGTIEWSVYSGTLPKGLTLSSNGVISGTAKETGNFSITLKAKNSYGSKTKKYTLIIKDYNYVKSVQVSLSSFENPKLGATITKPTVTITNVVATGTTENILDAYVVWRDNNGNEIDAGKFEEKTYDYCIDIDVKDTETTAIDYESMPEYITVNGVKFEINSVCGSYAIYSKKYSLEVKKTYELSKTSFVYNGKTQKPTVVVKDKNGNVINSSNYTVTYPDYSKKIGNYSVTVKFKSPYIGTKSLNYSITPDKVNGVKAKVNSNNTIDLSWKAVDGNIKGYEVYMYSDALGKYKYVGKTPYTSFTVNGLDECTKYKFKVRAYTKASPENVYGKYSTTVSAMTKIISVPTISKITAASKRAKLIWDKVGCADGYQIYMKSEKDTDYTKVKTIKSNTCKYTKYDLKNGTKYYFKVRAYKIIDGKAYYSPYSKTKSVQL
jgi:hypothetical protein